MYTGDERNVNKVFVSIAGKEGFVWKWMIIEATHVYISFIVAISNDNVFVLCAII